MASIPKIQKALHPHISKIDPSIMYPFKCLQNIPYPFKFFGQYPCIPKNLPGPHLFFVHMSIGRQADPLPDVDSQFGLSALSPHGTMSCDGIKNIYPIFGSIFLGQLC